MTPFCNAKFLVKSVDPCLFAQVRRKVKAKRQRKLPFLVGSPGKALRRNPGNAPELMHWYGFFPGRAVLTRATGWCGLVFVARIRRYAAIRECSAFFCRFIAFLPNRRFAR
ncbi:hypothetical protein DN614_17935 [Klebsiella michiganensis]|nr:hypothetical protein DN614_17935 [Klebsiella michiganensis]